MEIEADYVVHQTRFCTRSKPDQDALPESTGITALADLAERRLAGWPTREKPDEAALAASRARALTAGAKQ